jgi:hypothetical protein
MKEHIETWKLACHRILHREGDGVGVHVEQYLRCTDFKSQGYTLDLSSKISNLALPVCCNDWPSVDQESGRPGLSSSYRARSPPNMDMGGVAGRRVGDSPSKFVPKRKSMHAVQRVKGRKHNKGDQREASGGKHT